MNHSGNEHLSSGSPQAGVLTKDFVPNIWYTLYFSTGQGCWNTAHVMECFTESDAGEKKVFACMSENGRGPLHNTSLRCGGM